MVRDSSIVLALCMFASVNACPFMDMDASLLQQDADGVLKMMKNHIGCDGFDQSPVGEPPLYDITFEGCTCNTKCSATPDDLYDCDWCYTDDSCGHSGLTGYYDYCSYPLNQTYQSQSWSEKMDYLWENIIADTTSAPATNVAYIPFESIQTTFDDNWDVMPYARTKDIHGQGTMCKVSFSNQNADTNFTGVWEYGSEQHGLVRMGPALPATTKSGLVPGLGIKFLRSGVRAASYVALVGLDPLPDKNYDFFAANFTNHIPAPSGATAILAEKFFQASTCVTQVGLSDTAAYTVDGAVVDVPVFPYRLEMYSDIAMSSDPKTSADVLALMEEIEAGTTLFTIYAYTDPWHYSSGEEPLVLGTMVTDEACTNSNFGDASLFYQHQRIEEDWALADGWMEAMDPKSDCGAKTISMDPPANCMERDTGDMFKV